MEQLKSASCSRPNLVLSSQNFKTLQPQLHPLQTTQIIVTARNKPINTTSPSSTESSPELVAADQLEKCVHNRIASAYFPLEPPSQTHPAHSAPYADSTPISPDTAKIAIQASMPPPLTIPHRASYAGNALADDAVPQPLSPVPPPPISKSPTFPPKAFLSCPEVANSPIPVYHETNSRVKRKPSPTASPPSYSAATKDSIMAEKRRASARSSHDSLQRKYRSDDLQPLRPTQNPQPVKPFSLFALLCPCVARRLATKQHKARSQTYNTKKPNAKSSAMHEEKKHISNPKRIPNETYQPSILKQHKQHKQFKQPKQPKQSTQSNHVSAQYKQNHSRSHSKQATASAAANAASTKHTKARSRPSTRGEACARTNPASHHTHLSELEGRAAPAPGVCELDSRVALSAVPYSPDSKPVEMFSPVSAMRQGLSPVSMVGTACSPLSPQRDGVATSEEREPLEKVERWDAHDFGPRREERRLDARLRTSPITRRV